MKIIKMYLAFFLSLALLYPVSVSAQDSTEISYMLRFGFIAGNHESDLEQRWHDDILYGSLLNRGIGFSMPWENKYANGSFIDGVIAYKDWQFFLLNSGVISNPNWSYFTSIPVSSVQANTVLTRQMELGRGDNELGVSYAFWKKDGHSIRGKLALKNRFLTGDLSGLGVLSFSSASAFIIEDATLEGLAGGVTPGIIYGYEWDQHEVSAGLSFYNMVGTWNYDVLFIFAPSTLTKANESGDYKITGNIFTLAYAYRLNDHWKLLISFEHDQAAVTDSNVMNYNLSVTSGSSPTLSFNILTYLGSTKRDELNTLRIGAEYLF